MYEHKKIEKKWQGYWEKNNTFKTENVFNKPKFYTLDMFPYPSGAGLHVGHPEWYTANDIVARFKHANGYNVLHPMGWDAFGLPAENYAIKTGTHPRITTAENIATFKKQIKSLGFSYDWSREIDTTDPKYFKWTQWIFLKMFEHWLAYEQDLPINYCPSCKTGLANEEVLSDFTCERCGTKVEKRKIRQWVLAITKYADRLASDVEKLDWPKWIKDMQTNWIGRSEGCEFEMKKKWDETKSIKVYTTRLDTVFGMTYAVIAPDHPHVRDFIEEDNWVECSEYIDKANSRSDQDRTAENKEKTGVFTGSYVVNPFNGEIVPLWIGDYVLGSYGTGAVMAVAAHDDRDFAFADKYKLPVMQVIQWGIETPYCEDGILMNSWEFNWLSSKEARSKLMTFAEEKWFGHKKVHYKLRDWLFSRQRYWGEPIPLIHLAIEDVKKLPHIDDISKATDENLAYILKREPRDWESSCDASTCHGKVRELIIGKKVFSKIYDGIYGKIVCDYRLPLMLPEVERYEPAGDGQSPLASVESYVSVKLADNLSGKRETNTMPQWGGSCWYYLRYMDALNDNALVDKEVEKYWGSVDSYVGWAEHAVLHLLYARFWHKFLFDIGVVSTDEPFFRLRNQGMILGLSYRDKAWKLIANDLVNEKEGKYFHKETGEELTQLPAKMSKSLKNVINPDEVVDEYGADTLRLYEMYMGDFKDTKPWDTKAIVGVRRFLDKLDRTFEGNGQFAEDDGEAMRLLHKTIKKVWEDIEEYRFNTSISQMMILLNYGIPKWEKLSFEWKKTFALVLHPFAPHFAEELWEHLGEKESIFFASWPKYDEKMVVDNTVKIGVQVNGKVRGDIEIEVNEEKESVLAKAKANVDVAKWIDWKEIVKEVYVPGKILNIVIK